MREIKFRGLDLMDGTWVYGDLIKTWTRKTYIVNSLTGVTHRVDKNTVGQFTGMKAKNNQEIFEGDIVILTKPPQPFVVNGKGYEDVDFDEGFLLEGEVRFLYGCWFIDEGDGKGCPLDFDGDQVLEVIGNVHDESNTLEET
ncbi:YopX family protein [Rossellomorea marisflavi]|uniref:YopX family protein n=1 Tax=Rossellomorea marisflavi TaxID=189381 RepID=UPI003D2F466E